MQAAFARLQLEASGGDRIATSGARSARLSQLGTAAVSGIAIHTTWPWLDDVYLVLTQAEGDNRATFHVFVNPLVICIWAGGWLFLLGTLVVAWPEGVPSPPVCAPRPPREAVASGA